MKRTKHASITGRDGYIIAQALAYASEWLATLDEIEDEPSNRRDMDLILDAIGGNWIGSFRYAAKVKLGILEPVSLTTGESVIFDRVGLPTVEQWTSE
jgi:hypothetical protein